MKASAQRASCICTDCGEMIRTGLARRGFLRLAAGGAAALALPPGAALAQSKGSYKAMLLSCVDPRTQAPIAEWMDQPVPQSHTASIEGQYSQFTIAGAAIAVVAPAFASWRETFWANLAASIQLHDTRTLLAVDHGNCGALRIAYGARVEDDPASELAAHLADTKALQRELAVRHPEMGFQAWFVDRDEQGAFTRWRNLVTGPAIT